MSGAEYFLVSGLVVMVGSWGAYLFIQLRQHHRD